MDTLTRIWLVIIAIIFGILILAPHALVPNSYAASAANNSLTVNSSHGTASGGGSYSNGTVANFSISPTVVYSSTGTTRYVFDGWSCSGGGCYSGPAPSASVVMRTDITETASWITQFLLSANVTGNGTITPVGENWYNAGSKVPVSVASSGGPWLFAYWTLDGTNAGSSQIYTLQMNSQHDIVANFIEPRLESSMVNVSDSYGDNLRNPDGTFYRLDEFKISYNIYLTGGNPLPPNVSFIMNMTYPKIALYQSEIEGNYSTFVILPTSPLGNYGIEITAAIFNAVGNSTRSTSIYGGEPFTVVGYSPHFTCFAYTDFNSAGASSYQKPFVVIFRYSGNSPGYNYSGDINTDPFNALSSTRERAIINSFDFSTEGWSINPELSSSNTNNSLGLLQFEDHPNLTLAVSALNHTGSPVVITWQNRLQKFYFSANTQEIENYVTVSIVYFNVTLSADYSISYNSYNYKFIEFTASYLYQPIFYSGYLVINSSQGSQENLSVSITSHNPNPLTSYLISEASFSLLGSGNNDSNSQVVSSIIEQDLYPANSTTTLKPEELTPNSNEWVFLLNQTNIALLPNLDGMPYFTISLSGNIGATLYSFDPGNPPYNLSIATTNYTGKLAELTYNVTDYFGFALLNDLPGGVPFHNLVGYYVIQASPGEDLVMQPLGFSFDPSSTIPYLIRTYDNSSAPFFISDEPGNLTSSYPMIYGENVTTFLSPDFAGAGLVGMGNPKPIDGGSFYQVSLLFGAQVGGASNVWVISDKGQVLYNESLVDSSTANSTSISPNGYTGEFTFEFPTGDTSNSVTIYVENSWGGMSIIEGVIITPHSPPGLTFPASELAGLLIASFAISCGYFIFGARRKRPTTELGQLFLRCLKFPFRLKLDRSF